MKLKSSSVTRLKYGVSIVLVAAVTTGSPGFTSAAFAAAKVQDSGPTEVVVQAQRREQRLTDVPMAVEVISTNRLAEAHVTTAKDMQVLTPGLIIDTTISPNLTTARIRGIGTVGDNPGLESSVGIVVDGVYRSRNSAAVNDEIDLDHVEVIKGPQGTLYGKNTTAGLISLFSKKPSFTPGGELSAGAGNHAETDYALRLTGPIGNDHSLAGSLSFSHEQHGGYDKVIIAQGPRTATTDDTLNSNTAKAQLLALPNDDLSIRLIADYTRYKGACCLAVQSLDGPTAAILNALTGGMGVAPTADITRRTAYANQPDGFINQDQGVTILTDLKLDPNTTLSSITGVRSSEVSAATDVDYSGADLLYRRPGDYSNNFKTMSEEVRLHRSSEHFDQMAGFYLSNEDLDARDGITMGRDYETFLSLLLSRGKSPTFVSALTGLAPGTSFAAGSGSEDEYIQHDQSTAVYYNLDYKPVDRVELVAGVRYTEDRKKFSAQYSNSPGDVGCGKALALYSAHGGAWPLLTAAQQQQALGGLCVFWANAAFNGLTHNQSKAESNVSGTVKAIYHFDRNMMAYVAWSTGYKAGGFNLDRATTGLTPDASLYFPKETIEAFEAGFNASLFDRTVTFNVTPFYERLRDFQLNAFLGTAYVVETVPTMTSKGVDADVYWTTPIKGLTITAGATYADTRYGKFTAADLDNPSHHPALSLLPGSQVGLAAKTSATSTVAWTGDIAGLKNTASISVKYSDPYIAGSDLLPNKLQKGYTLANASWYVTLPAHGVTLSVWVKNLTNRTIKETVIAAPLQGSGFQATLQPGGSYYAPALDTNTYAAFLAEPRTYGITLSAKF